jgi:hypothetical protein
MVKPVFCTEYELRDKDDVVDITCPVDDHRIEPNSKGKQVEIKVQSGAVIDSQYLGLLDHYN